MKKCFVVSPIGHDGSEIRRRADQVYKYIIAPVCNTCGFEAVRVDQLNQSDSITQTILDMLIQSELVIADITGHNPNAFYEMGYRACTGKPMIHLKEKGEPIPFDIASIRTFDYDLTDLDSVAEIKSRLEQTVSSFNFLEVEDNEPSVANQEIEKRESSLGTSQLLPILYDIQDQITNLRSEIHDKDTETIQAIVRAGQPNAPIEDPNTSLMKVLLPEMLRNPNSFKSLMEISEMMKGKNEKKK